MDFTRIKKLRDKAVEPKINYTEFYLHFYEYFDKKGAEYTNAEYGNAFYYACAGITPVIEDDELIVGKPLSELTANDLMLWENKYSKVLSETYTKTQKSGQDSHMAIDYELLLDCGIKGIIEKIGAYKTNCTQEQTIFYNNCKKCLEGALLLAKRYSNYALELSRKCDSIKRKAELEVISQIFENVPLNPAKSYYEAIQSVHFVTHLLSFAPLSGFPQQFQLGHPDRYLYKFYEHDLKNGIISKDFAHELFDMLAIHINNRVPSGLSSGYMVGGRDENGNVVANDITMFGLEAIEDLKLVYPAVGLCYTADMPDEYLIKSCDILGKGCSHPAIFNDDIITEGLKYYGVPKNEASNYIHSTCVEITPVASSNAWVASPYTNLIKLLLDIMNEEYNSFKDLKDKYYAILSNSIKNEFKVQDELRKHRETNAVNPFLSCFVNNCLENGKDIESGGARYNWIMPSFVGMANLTDSLYAIKTLVFDKKELSLTEYKKAVNLNFKGYESLQAEILNKIPKYGNDIEEVDEIFTEVSAFIINECKKHTPIFKNGKLIPSVFCWIMHERFGSETGASPDGRCANFPFGDGSGPAQGREISGPTASIMSSTKWSHKEFIGGVAVNMKFNKSSFNDGSIQKIMSLIKTFIARGGFEMQINVTDSQTLKEAKQNPSNYSDLVVRIGGYSDYFVRLTPNMQDEVILRTEHNI